jgi:hypothetical protein
MNLKTSWLLWLLRLGGLFGESGSSRLSVARRMELRVCSEKMVGEVRGYGEYYWKMEAAKGRGRA